MKIHQWTLGLAAAGLVTVPSVSRAEEQQMNHLFTALTPTTLSGYVNTSMHWTPGTGNGVVPSVVYNTPRKQDGFNLNTVDLEVERPMDEAQWAAGYKVQLWFGQDAATFGTSQAAPGNTPDEVAIRQAYVALRAPVGNGLEFKIGTYDPVVGYESHDAGKNPNYTRAYSTTIEPFSHTGVLMSYQFTSAFAASVGVANTLGPVIAGRANPPKAESYKTYTGSLAVSAPEDWGFIAGSTLYAGVVNGYSAGNDWDQTLWYVGLTMNTPVKGWRVGATYDYLGTTSDFSGDDHYANALAAYTSLQLTDKLSVHGRAEYAWTDTDLLGSAANIDGGNSEVFALTGTLQYDLWQNVLSRVEIRWDHQAGDGDMIGYGGPMPGFGGGGFGGSPAPEGSRRNNVLFAANIIYSF